MDRITQIETGLQEVLIGIDGTQVGVYQYLNDVKSVYFEQEDEVVSITKSIDSGYPNIVVKMDPDETILEGESKAYQNLISYILECKVSLDKPVSNPKQALKTKMNELAQDVKFALSANDHLNDTCDDASITRLSRRYNTEGNALRSGDLIIYLNVIYTQSRLNPSINVCA